MDMKELVDIFYNVYTEFYKKCGDRIMAIQLTCAMCGLEIPKADIVQLMFEQKDGKKKRCI